MILANCTRPLDGRPRVDGFEETLQIRIRAKRILGALLIVALGLAPVANR